jgi:L-aspartate oxidase
VSQIIQTDFLVLGSGIAGLWFALRAADWGKVLVATKKEDSESNTNYAQGGIAAALAENDSSKIHYEDTIQAGAGLAHEPAVRVTTTEGPKLVAELIKIGVQFSRFEDSAGKIRFDLGQEGGHSRRRIVHAKDSTGYEIEKGLLAALHQKKVEILEDHFAVDLLTEDGECFGASVIDLKTDTIKYVKAQTTLLATGGIGQVYFHTTNPRIATGDGIAMSYRAGARIANMEFIQFHPTSLFGHKIDDRAFLISEAVRGEGGILKTLDGNPFMERYHPLVNLAPRDVIARAIDAELKSRNETHVLLDVTHLDKEYVRTRFPKIFKTCFDFGININERPIPVVPAAHYVCGGVATDLWGRTSIKRLFTAGECACSGVHGANRLASNSLLEGLVFADRAAIKAKEMVTTNPRSSASFGTKGAAASFRSAPRVPLESASICVLNKSDRYRIIANVGKDLSNLRMRLKQLMWNHAAIVRNTKGLMFAREELEKIATEVARILPAGTIDSEVGELQNMLTVARLIIRCALERKESRGLHYNEDYPERDDKTFKHDTIIDRPF